MRKRTRFALPLALVGVMLATSLAFCRDSTTPLPRGPVYVLHFATLADTSPAEHLWYFGDKPNVVYKSLHSPRLEKWLTDLPKDSVIEYWPTSMPLIGKRFFDPDSDAHAFGLSCQSKGIHFTDQFPTL